MTCRNCKYVKKGWFGSTYDKCKHPKTTYTYCTTELNWCAINNHYKAKEAFNIWKYIPRIKLK